MAFKLRSSPHISQASRTSTLMRNVTLLALAGLVPQSYFFGLTAVVQVLLCALTAIAAEVVVLKLRNRSLAVIRDNSALLTGVLLGLALPVYAPWWVAVIGSTFAIIVVKHLYGGLGNNLFNPAMAAYVMLLISFPLQMTQFPAPNALQANAPDLMAALGAIFTAAPVYDGVTMATLLDGQKTALASGQILSEYRAMPGSQQIEQAWFYINFTYLLAGIVLIWKKWIRWHIPVSILASSALLYLFAALVDNSIFPTPYSALFSGAMMLGAFFIATDPVSAATSNKTRLIYGALIGLLIFIIREFGGYPDGVAFAVLLANLCVPFLDHFIRPTTYGHNRS